MFKIIALCLVFTWTIVLSVERIHGNEPILTLKSSSIPRLLKIADALGIPNPLGASKSSGDAISQFQDDIDLKTPVGGYVFVSEGIPHLVICLPITEGGNLLESRLAAEGKKFSRTASGALSLGEDGGFFASQTNSHLIFSDSQSLSKTVGELLANSQWTPIRDDIQIQGSLETLHPFHRSMLRKECLSMINSKPTTDLVLNPSSIRDHLRFNLQKYLVQSILDCKSFELTLNANEAGEVTAKLDTLEQNQDLDLRSAFTLPSSARPTLAVDFSTRLDPSTTNDLLAWVSKTESQWTRAISGSSVADTSDLESSKRVLRLFAELIVQSVNSNQIDGMFALGNSKGEGYFFGALVVTDGARLGKLLSSAIESSRAFGFTYQNVRPVSVQNSSNDLEFILDIPKAFGVNAASQNDQRLHVRLVENRLLVCLGEEAERLSSQALVNSSESPSTAVAIALDLNGEQSTGENQVGILPADFRQLRLNVSKTERGRSYSVVLGKSNDSGSTK